VLAEVRWRDRTLFNTVLQQRSTPWRRGQVSLTRSQEADGWYVCCSCAKVPSKLLPCTGNATGIDVALQVFFITADGQIVAHLRHRRQAERDLKKADHGGAAGAEGSSCGKRKLADLGGCNEAEVAAPVG
jgi:hypothetical protein